MAKNVPQGPGFAPNFSQCGPIISSESAIYLLKQYIPKKTDCDYQMWAELVGHSCVACSWRSKISRKLQSKQRRNQFKLKQNRILLQTQNFNARKRKMQEIDVLFRVQAGCG